MPTPMPTRRPTPLPSAAPAEANPRSTADAHGGAHGGVRKRLSSAALLQGGGEIEIDHAGAIYRLRITSLGKLILTK